MRSKTTELTGVVATPVPAPVAALFDCNLSNSWRQLMSFARLTISNTFVKTTSLGASVTSVGAEAPLHRLELGLTLCALEPKVDLVTYEDA